VTEVDVMAGLGDGMQSKWDSRCDCVHARGGLQSTIQPGGPRAKGEILKIPHEPVYHPHTAGARFIQTLQQECLDYFVVFGEQHMNYVDSEMVAHYHEERPHQGKRIRS
jgi:hypothetical protein